MHADERLSSALSGLDDIAKEYGATFQKAADTFLERGLPETGAQGRLRKAAHELERIVEDIHDLPSTIALLQVRRAEKDFLLRNEQKYADLNHSLSQGLEASLKAKDDHSEERKRAKELLREYDEGFGSVVDATKRLDALQLELHESFTRMEPKIAEVISDTERHAATLLGEVNSVREQALATLLIAFAIVLALGGLAVTWISRQIAGGITLLMEGTRRVAEGDLTAAVAVGARDELGQLALAFNRMLEGLRELNTQINGTSATLVTIAGELSATVSEQSASVQQQASAVTETVSTIEEMTRSATSVAETAQSVSSGAAASVEASSRGEAALKQSVEGMLAIREQVQNIAATILELSERTQQIGGIIATVDDFAEQSSLLALNASIEAARAGEQGKAFSVVATEIKKLAEQSQQATDKVRSILGEIQRATHSAVMVTEEGSKRVDRGVGLVETAGTIVMELVETIKGSARSAKQIAAAAQQQASGVGQVSTAMTGIDQSSRQNVAAIKQTEMASQNLASITRDLQKTTARYRLA
jgi:methyl-accepting chemotaxis protein